MKPCQGLGYANPDKVLEKQCKLTKDGVQISEDNKWNRIYNFENKPIMTGIKTFTSEAGYVFVFSG